MQAFRGCTESADGSNPYQVTLYPTGRRPRGSRLFRDHVTSLASSHPVGDHPVILIVEDDESVRQSLGRVLVAHGFSVHVASSVADAVRCGENVDLDAVILDLSLSGKESGLDFLGWLRTEPRHAHLPVLILTGRNVLPEDEEALIRRQRAYVFYKPQPYDLLIDYLKRLTHFA